MDELWLPEGHHWDLHIEHKPLPDAGPFTGGGWKLVWHTTESSWMAVDAMWNVLRDKDAAPHFIIGGRQGREHPVVIQCIALNRAARALAHPSGPETNRANAIQVEICGRAAQSHLWSDGDYETLANLSELIMHRVDIPNNAPRDFSNPRRYTGAGWVQAKGHVGHSMCPGNDHWDPGRFREGTLVNLIDKVPDGGYPLSGGIA